MPFYEYECTSCRFYSEVMQRISEPPLKKCPSCGKSTMKKLVSVPNFRLKGGGWYETDFKSDQEKKRNLALEKEPESKPAPEKGESAAPTDAKAGEAKAAEPKPAEAKSPESKSAQAKPAQPAPKSTARRTVRTKSKLKSRISVGRRSRR